MVGLMTYGKRQFEHLDPAMRRLIPPFHRAMGELLAAVDADAEAFSSYMEAMKMPRSTPEEKDRRSAAMQEGLKKAVGAPLGLAQKVNTLWPGLKEMALHGNASCTSDLQVAAKALETGVFGAYFNVLINLKDVRDDHFRRQMQEDISRLLEEAQSNAASVLESLAARTE